MSSHFLFLQLLLVISAVLIIIFGEPIYSWFRARLMDKTIEEATIHDEPWYKIRSVETGILEVALAVTAASLTLPSFAPANSKAPEFVELIFHSALLISSGIAAFSSMWLFKIYIKQQAAPGIEERIFPHPKADEWLFWLRNAGPYSLLAFSIIFLIISICLLTFIISFI